MKFGAAHDWRDSLAFDIPIVVADAAPGEPTRCSVCGGDSAPLARTDVWVIKHRHPTNHHGYLRFYCREHLPVAKRQSPPADRPRQRTAERHERAARTAALVEKEATMCPSCFVVVPATGVCGMCGTRVG